MPQQGDIGPVIAGLAEAAGRRLAEAALKMLGADLDVVVVAQVVNSANPENVTVIGLTERGNVRELLEKAYARMLSSPPDIEGETTIDG